MLHTNLYWQGIDPDTEIVYARPNNHNINLDGSIGDDDEKLINEKPTDFQFAKQTAASFSMCAGMMLAEKIVSSMNSEQVKIKKMVDMAHVFTREYIHHLPTDLKILSANTDAIQEVIDEYQNRKKLVEKGCQTKKGIEYWNDDEFLLIAEPLTQILEVFKSAIQLELTKEEKYKVESEWREIEINSAVNRLKEYKED